MTDNQLRACAALIDIVIEAGTPLPPASEMKLWRYAHTCVPCVNELDDMDAIEVMSRLPAIVANSTGLIKLASVLSDIFQEMDKAYTEKASSGAPATMCAAAAQERGRVLLEPTVSDPEIQNIVLDSLTKRLGHPFHSQAPKDKGAVPLAAPHSIPLATPTQRGPGRPVGSKTKPKATTEAAPEPKAATPEPQAEAPAAQPSSQPAETANPPAPAPAAVEQPKAEEKKPEEIPPLQKPKSSIVNLINASRDEQLDFLGAVKTPLENVSKQLSSVEDAEAKPVATKVNSLLSDLNKAQGSPRHAINITLRALTEKDIKTLIKEMEALPELTEENKASIERLRSFLKSFVDEYPNTFGYFEPAALVGD